jgi:hypothetical protein
MNKQDAMKRIEAIEAEAAALRKMVQEPEPERQGLWRPQEGDTYFPVNWDMYIPEERNNGHPSDSKVAEFGACFPTRKAAAKAAPLFARTHKIIQAALMADPDAGALTKGHCMWSVLFATEKGRWQPFDSYYTDCSAAYVHTREQAERMAAILNAEGV